jgi:hypothetical protein
MLSLRGVPVCGTTKQSSWIATARFAHLAMTIVSQTRLSGAGGGISGWFVDDSMGR